MRERVVVRHCIDDVGRDVDVLVRMLRHCEVRCRIHRVYDATRRSSSLLRLWLGLSLLRKRW